MNENYPHPEMPKGNKCEEGILKGMYKIKEFNEFKKTKIQLLGSGAILREMIAAAEILQNDYQIDSEIWSITSFNELRKDGMEVERYNLLNPDKDQKISYVEQCLGKTEGPIMGCMALLANALCDENEALHLQEQKIVLRFLTEEEQCEEYVNFSMEMMPQ